MKKGLSAAMVVLAVFVLSNCTLQGMATKHSAYYTLKTPDGNGPFAAVVLMHGCSGIGPNINRWATRLNGWGYAALIVDSFGPRGATDVCEKPLSVDPRTARTADAYNAAEYLRGLPMIDPNRIAIIGFSHGGSAVMNVVQQGAPATAGAKPFQAAVAYYPGCRSKLFANVSIPLLILIGEEDDWASAKSCQALVAGLSTPDLVQLQVYKGAFHGFDSPGRSRTYLGHHLAYDPTAAEDSFAKVQSFLENNLKR